MLIFLSPYSPIDTSHSLSFSLSLSLSLLAIYYLLTHQYCDIFLILSLHLTICLYVSPPSPVVSKIALDLTGSMIVPYQGVPIDLSPPWRRVPMHTLVQEKCGKFKS